MTIVTDESGQPIDDACLSEGGCKRSVEECSPYGCQLVAANFPQNWCCAHPAEHRRLDGSCGQCGEQGI
jgi:hypothetical protein